MVNVSTLEKKCDNMVLMKIQIISLLPDVLEPYFQASMMRKAVENGQLVFSAIDLRQFGVGPRLQVDDTPYGGGDGMVLRLEPLVAAVEETKHNDPDAKVLLMTPRGKTLSQEWAQQTADDGRGLIIICGRYEGYDQRITEWVDEEVSIGNFVLTGGELPAMIVADSVVRLIPGVLGGETSAMKESFADGITKEHPHYTRPEEFKGLKVPEVLLQGNHAEIEKWRKENSK